MKEQAISSCITALSSYRKFCATVTSAGQLILPEALKLLPLYTLGTSLSLNFTILVWFAECNIVEQKLWCHYIFLSFSLDQRCWITVGWENWWSIILDKPCVIIIYSFGNSANLSKDDCCSWPWYKGMELYIYIYIYFFFFWCSGVCYILFRWFFYL